MTKNELTKKIIDTLVKEDENCEEAVDAFKSLMRYLLLNKSELFEPVLEAANYDMEADQPTVETSYFGFTGVMLYDNIYGKPANKSHYLYRSKGSRLFLTSDNEIALILPYSSMDNTECSFVHELILSHDLDYINNYDDVLYCLQYFDSDKYPNSTLSQKMLIMLDSINEVLPRGHFIELFLTPPDYQRTSKITREILDLIWTRLLVSDGKKAYTEVEIKIATKKLIDVDITPEFHSFVALINLELNRDVGHIKKVLTYMSQVSMSELHHDIKKISEKGSDIIEVKPSFLGVSIDFKAILKWIKKTLTL